MPAVSQQQFKFMEAVKGGYIHPKGLSKAKAAEFTQGVHPSELPKTKKPKFKKLSKYYKDTQKQSYIRNK